MAIVKRNLRRGCRSSECEKIRPTNQELVKQAQGYLLACNPASIEEMAAISLWSDWQMICLAAIARRDWEESKRALANMTKCLMAVKTNEKLHSLMMRYVAMHMTVVSVESKAS